MAYDELMADRLRGTLKHKSIHFVEKKMFGGLCFMVDEKMCVGVIKNDLMVRIDPELVAHVITKTGARFMDFTGKTMKGFLMISAEGVDMDEDLEYWVQLCLNFNPKAKSSKKK